MNWVFLLFCVFLILTLPRFGQPSDDSIPYSKLPLKKRYQVSHQSNTALGQGQKIENVKLRDLNEITEELLEDLEMQFHNLVTNNKPPYWKSLTEMARLEEFCINSGGFTTATQCFYEPFPFDSNSNISVRLINVSRDDSYSVDLLKCDCHPKSSILNHETQKFYVAKNTDQSYFKLIPLENELNLKIVDEIFINEYLYREIIEVD